MEQPRFVCQVKGTDTLLSIKFNCGGQDSVCRWANRSAKKAAEPTLCSRAEGKTKRMGASCQAFEQNLRASVRQALDGKLAIGNGLTIRILASGKIDEPRTQRPQRTPPAMGFKARSDGSAPL